MVFKVRMPRIDANIEEGSIGRWLADCGDPIRAGRPLVEIITDKASFELEAEQGGILRAQVAAEKSVVPVGYVIALIGQDAAEPLPQVEEENEAVLAAYRRKLTAGLEPVAAGTDAGPAPEPLSGAVRATPAARRLAARAGLSLEAVANRVQGVVRRGDVEGELKRRGREQKL